MTYKFNARYIFNRNVYVSCPKNSYKNVHSSSIIHYYLKLEIIQISNETVACVNSDILTQWNTLLQSFSTRDNCAPQQTSGNVWIHFRLSQFGGATVLYWVEVTMLVNILHCTGESPTP